MRPTTLLRHVPLALTVLVLLAARSSLADHYVVPSGSMQPTLQPGDRVLVDKRAYGLRLPFTAIALSSRRGPERGDIAIFDSPSDGTRLIKRVVAVGGDTVELRAGHLSVNGAAVADAGDPTVERFGAHTARLDLRRGGGPDISPTRVPHGHVLLLGDARGNSVDGRFFGFVRASELYARALGVYYRSQDGLVWRPL